MELMSTNSLGYVMILQGLGNTNVSSYTQDSWSALLCAAQEGHTEIAKLLLEKEADLNIPDKVTVLE